MLRVILMKLLLVNYFVWVTEHPFSGLRLFLLKTASTLGLDIHCIHVGYGYSRIRVSVHKLELPSVQNPCECPLISPYALGIGCAKTNLLNLVVNAFETTSCLWGKLVHNTHMHVYIHVAFFLFFNDFHMVFMCKHDNSETPKATQLHPRPSSFKEKNELPRVGLEATTFRVLDRRSYPPSY